VLADIQNHKDHARKILLRVFDPLGKEPFLEHPIESARRLMRDIPEINRARFNQILERLTAAMALKVRNGIATDTEQTCTAIFRELWQTTNCRVEANLQKLVDLERERKTTFADLHKELLAKGIGKQERDQIFNERRSQFETNEEGVRESLSERTSERAAISYAF